MNSSNFEQKWQLAMQKARQQQAKQKTGAPLATQEKQNKEEMDYFKQKILKSFQRGDKEETKKTATALIKLRAKSAAIKMQKAQVENGFLSEATTKKIIAKYTQDCLRLVHSLGYK
ncbi:MAG: hypothetical protein HZC26_03755 [Candidatus Magasanikbacteria bacterium]|nr:hypothetical protein [Candidatus Magasanikbacteria bacterium]